MEKKSLIKALNQVIRNEDPRNPLTDQEIARHLHISRSEVSVLRSENGIEDSRERRRGLLMEAIESILKEDTQSSVRVVTGLLNERGFRISRNGVAGLLKQAKESMEVQEVEPKEVAVRTRNHESKAFSALIGSGGSLKAPVELAKAAILYPNGLHTLIYGATGVGKSQMAECMYWFAMESKTLEANAPFVVFNCADYADNPQLLMAQLYGYKKGTFTGAAEDKAGLVEKADRGILFLDEIHRLPPEGQEILFHLIDKGKFRRLGETDVYRDAKILLIAATTENLESNLLATFRRRLPMVIEIPSLAERPFVERYKIAESFFKQEAARMNANLLVTKNVMKALILYEPSGNIGKMWSDIQVTCARSFLKLIARPDKTIKIDVTALPNEVVQGLLRLNLYRHEIDEVVTEDLKIYQSDEVQTQQLEEPPYLLPREIYKTIEEKYKEMQYRGIDEEIINRIIENELESQVYQSVKRIRKGKSKLVKNDLERIVGAEIVEVVEQMMLIAGEYYKEIDDSLFYCLATHLAASYDRLLQNESIKNPKLEKIKEQHPKEFRIAKEMAELAGDRLSIEIPEDEIAFIAMYVKASASKEMMPQNQVGVLVLSHEQVAQGMANVANRLLGVDHARAVEMSLDEAPSVALQRTLQISKEIASDKGILFLADMGSLVGFGKLVGRELSIKTRTVSRVDTMMVIEAVRKALMPDSNLDEIADSLQVGQLVDKGIATRKESLGKTKAIVSICLTGEGSAKILADRILESIESIHEEIQVIRMSAIEDKSIAARVEEVSQDHTIVAVVGTIDPGIASLPFIDARLILDGTGITLLHEYIREGGFKKPDKKSGGKDPQMVLVDELINETTTVLRANMLSKRECIEKMTNLLHEFGYVTEEFESSVYEREALTPTLFGGGIAVPHGDPQFVKKSIIGILTLEKPVLWNEKDQVDCIFFMAINEYYKAEFKKLYKLTTDPYLLKKIKESTSFEELREVIRNA